jgi:hypothetical protein
MAPAGRGGRGAAADVEEEDQVDTGAELAAAMEAELAVLESEQPAEEPVSEAAMPRRLPDLSMLAPGEEARPEPAAVDPTFDGPLIVPFPDRLQDPYHRELSHFLMLFARKFGIESRIENREAVLKLPVELLGYEAPDGEVRLPLFDEQQMEACLRRRTHVINPSRLLALCLGKGRVTALRAQPKLTQEQAKAILAKAVPERPVTNLTLVHEAFVQLNYQVTLRYYRKEERTISLTYGVEREVPAGALDTLMVPSHWLGEGVGPASMRGLHDAAVERLETQARDEVARKARERQAVVQREIDEDVRENVKILEDYYQEKAKELEDEKRAVYFHLYYFEKEEAIDKQLVKMKREKEDRARAMERFWDVKVDTRLLSLGWFEVPFWRAVDARADQLAVDALAGVALSRDGGYWLSEQDV